MSKNFRKVLILAAGRGKRLMPLTADKPKCLVPIGGHPILFYQLSALSVLGIKDIVIVTGYRARMIEEYARKHFPRLRIQFINNPRYLTTNKLYSWHLARDSVMENSLILDSDVLLHPAIIYKALSAPKEANIVYFERRRCEGEETKVFVGPDGRIMKIGKGLKTEETSGEAIGVYVFSKEVSKLFFSVAEELLRSLGQGLYGFDAIAKMISDHSAFLFAKDIAPHPAIEIDFPEDVKTAEDKILPQIISQFTI